MNYATQRVLFEMFWRVLSRSVFLITFLYSNIFGESTRGKANITIGRCMSFHQGTEV